LARRAARPSNRVWQHIGTSPLAALGSLQRRQLTQRCAAGTLDALVCCKDADANVDKMLCEVTR
jgi:hypothetical protein